MVKEGAEVVKEGAEEVEGVGKVVEEMSYCHRATFFFLLGRSIANTVDATPNDCSSSWFTLETML